MNPYLLRAFALMRHWMVVCARHPPGPARDAEWACHVDFVFRFYRFFFGI